MAYDASKGPPRGVGAWPWTARKILRRYNFDRANHKFNVVELAWPQKIPTCTNLGT